MKIQADGPLPPAASLRETRQAEAQEKPGSQGSAAPVISEVRPGAERVSISPAARRLLDQVKATAVDDAGHRKRIDELKEAVRTGSYRADPKAVADGILKDFLMLQSDE